MAFVQKFGNNVNPYGTSNTVALSGVTANNLLVAILGCYDGDSSAFTTPSGWTLIETTGGVSSSATVRNGAMFYKVADGSETSVTFTWTTSARSNCTLIEYSGADAISPLEDSGKSVSTDTLGGDPKSAGSATPTSANGQAVSGIVGKQGNGPFTINDSFVVDGTTNGDGNSRPQSRMASRTYSSTASISPDWDISRVIDWAAFAAIAVFKDAAGGGVTVTLSAATESDAAVALDITTAVVYTPGTATETNAALPLSFSADVVLTLGAAAETDAAQPLSITSGVLVALGTAAETDAAQPLTITTGLRLELGAALETDAAQPLTFGTTVILTLGVASETDVATGLSITDGTELTGYSLPDAARAYFTQRGYTGTANDQFIQWCQANGATSDNLMDAWKEMCAANLASPTGNLVDDWYYLLGVQGVTQTTVNGRERAFFIRNRSLVSE